MADYTLIDSDAAAVELAGLLNGGSRTRPVAVLTSAAGQAEPYIDVAKVAGDLEGLVDVYVIPTGPRTWAFSGNMHDDTSVYGGAGRVYPVGHEWVHDVRRSPLRFAWRAADGPKATERLIDDGLNMAAAAGLLEHAAASPRAVRRQGEVKRADNERAWVDFGDGGLSMGIVPPQLAEPELPIERVLRPGMVVSGAFDPESRRFDIRESRQTQAAALDCYQVGDVILVEIMQVRNGSAVARIFPSVTVGLGRADVTPDDADLRTLLSAGETVAARVLRKSPWWLTLLEVDEEPVEGASVYPDGPPWLLPPAPPEPEPEEPEPEEPEPEPVLVPPAAAKPEVRRPVFSPAQMPSRRGGRVRPAATVAEPEPAPVSPPVVAPVPEPVAVPDDVVADLALMVDELRAQAETFDSRLTALEEELKGVRYERDQLEGLKSDAEESVARLETELKKSRSALRKASSRRAGDAPQFADRERGFRHLVEAAWARRIPVGEQPARPLPDYVIGDQFLDCVESVQGITPAKIADVVVELLTGMAKSKMHRLRTGTGGDTPVRQRESDGAVCWRIALQIHTPSARRLHAWKLPDGRWELSSVRKHDDFDS